MIRWPGAALLCLLSGLAGAVELIRVELGIIEAPAWTIQGAMLTLDLGNEEPGLALHVAHIRAGDLQIQAVTLRCQAFSLLADRVECPRAQLDFTFEGTRVASRQAAFSWQFSTRQLDVSVDGLGLAGGTVDLVFSGNPAGWRLTTGLTRTGVAGLAALARQLAAEIPEVRLQGDISGTLVTTGSAAEVQRIDWQLRSHALGYDTEAGDQAAEGLQLSSRGYLQRQAVSWRIEASIDAREGMLYSDPLYLEFTSQQPLKLAAELDWQVRDERLVVRRLSFEQPRQLRGQVSGSLRLQQPVSLERLQLQLDEAVLPAFYDTWLQPWLAGTAAGKLETAGRLSGRVSLSDNVVQSVYMDADQVTFRDSDGVFGVQGLSGALYWGGLPRDTTLRWQGANVYKLAFGPAELALQSNGRHLKLTRPMVVDLLDGQLHVDSFELGQDDGGFRWLLDGMLTPVSMQAFSKALGWVPLSGKLSGMIPRMRYENGELTLGGVLLVQAFDGDITVRNLRIQRPFGLVPRLWADVRVNDIDLETLTRTFDFGRIEGRLSGEVNRLYMEAWQTVAFDAWFKTPEDDRSRHRISQRAVDNISNIGGAGIGGAVSRGMLKFFKDFPYRRLGIRCRLENGVCHMGGVGDLDAGSGYYLVQGRLLPPRLDVIGYSREVDWPSLLERLRAGSTLRPEPR